MSTSTARPQAAGGLAVNARGLLRFVYTHNPFYVISAWFVFTGLRMSFDPQGEQFDTSALALSLAGYTVLLALTAWALIRLGQVWEDVRSLLILIVLTLMALSVAIDDVLMTDLRRGMLGAVAGLLFSIAISEALLRGMRLRLPWLYRGPFYLLLGLLFLYPACLWPLAGSPHSPALQWGLFGFALLAAVMLLTLLPAVRRGPQLVRDNGTPWSWPWFPWTLFGTLGLCVCLRAYYLCISLHQVGGSGTIFGVYFLVPFLLAATLLLLEIGLVSRLPRVQQAALMVPLLLVGLVSFFQPQGLVYERFAGLFAATLGGSPLFYTLLAATLFYAMAVARNVRFASEALTAALGLMVLVGPATNELRLTGPLQGWPLLLAAMLQLGLGLWKMRSQRTFLAAVLATAGASLELADTWFVAYAGALPLHLLLLAVLLIGAAFRDPFARLLQQIGGGLLLLFSLAAVLGGQWLSDLPPLAMLVYPMVAAAAAVAFGYGLDNRWYLLAAAGCGCVWVAASMIEGYDVLRGRLRGLDQIAWGLAFFACAAAISLMKAGYFPRGLLRRPAETRGIDLTRGSSG